MRYESEEERKNARDAAVRKATAKYQASRKRVNAYFDDNEFDAIQRAAEIKGVSAGRYVRDAAVKSAQRDVLNSEKAMTSGAKTKNRRGRS